MESKYNNFGGDRLCLHDSGYNFSRSLNYFINKYRKINSRSIYDFLIFGSILPPNSPLEGVNSLFPGVTKSGGGEHCLYEDLNLDIKNQDFGCFVREIENMLELYFSKYKNDDNTVLLSGGIDSAIILSFLGKGSRCITWGGWGKSSSDIIYSKKTTEKFNIKDHELVYSDYEHDMDSYEKAVKELKIPLLYSNAVPYIRMAEVAQRSGVSRWFMGQNVDTLFMSYAAPVKVRNLILFNKLIRFNPLFFSKNRKKVLFSTTNIVKLFAYFKSGGIFPGPWLEIDNDYFNEKDKNLKKFIKTTNVNQRIVLTEQLLTESRKNQICQNELPLLFGITTNCPYYERNFIESVLRIPDEILRLDKYNKVVFRELAKKRGVPAEVIEKGKKGLSYGYQDFFEKKMHIPIWDKMQKDDFINSFIDVSEVRRAHQENYYCFDILRSLYFWGEWVAKPYNLTI